MPDTVRDRTTLQELFADNTSGDITAQDLRDLLASVDLSAEGASYLRVSSTALSMPEADGTAGQLLKTNADGTLGWFTPGVLSYNGSDPGSPAEGQMWYRSDLYELRVRANSATWRLTVSPVV